MFGSIGKIHELMAMLSNPEKAGEAIRDKVPAILMKIMVLLGKQCGAQEGGATGIVLFEGDTPAGRMLMARVHRVDEFGALGEELGTVAVPDALKNVDPMEIMAFFN